MSWSRVASVVSSLGGVLAVLPLGLPSVASAQDRGVASAVPVTVPVTLTVTDSAGRPAAVRIVAAVRRSTGDLPVDSGTTDRAGRVTVRVPADRSLSLTAFARGRARPLWHVALATAASDPIMLDVSTGPAGVRDVRTKRPELRRVNLWVSRVRAVLRRDPGATRDSLRALAIAEGEALWQASLVGRERQAVLEGLVSMYGARLSAPTATTLLRQLDPGDPYWLSTPLPAVVMPLVQATRGLARPVLDSSGRRQLLVVTDSLAALPRTLSPVADELLAIGALFAHQNGDSAGARRRWRAIESTRPASPVLRSLRMSIAPNRPVRVGAPVPAFSFESVRPGEARVTERSFTARVTLIDLWATWCPPCLVERPVLVEALAKWKARGFDVVSIGLDDSAAVERRFLEARPELSWRHAVAASPDGRLRRETAERFGVLGIPRWILVDSTGRVLEEQVLHLDSLLARHLGPP